MTNKTKISKKKSRESEKSFILSKVPASVKSTTVNVTIEDNYEKEQVAQSSASLSLSVELSKPIEIIQKPDAYHPIRRKQSLLVHSKVAPVTFSTSISASGNLSEEVLRSTRAIDYLTKEIEKDDIISHQPIANDLCQQSDIESTCDQNGLLNWLKKLREDGADDKLERHDSSIDIDYKNKTDSIRLSPSNNSLKRQDNQVLPTFNSLFIPEQEQTNNYHNLLVKTINAINAYLIPPKEQIINSHWFANKMKDKFEHFVQDIKSLDKRMDPRIVIIGVHGWFPMKLVRSMIGEPTGTSIKFCEQTASAVQHYFKTEHQVTLPHHAITLVPLEGEGKVEERVRELYEKLIGNYRWLEAVSSADIIFWATHSQGTPVSVLLLKMLLERGHIHTIRQSICLLAMAGISQGPFPALKGSLIVKYFEADAARELFEFMDSDSPISKRYHQALTYILNNHIKIVLTGSMQDQVVPLHSAVMSNLHHPNILRSIYIDGHFYSSDDFLVQLVVFSLRLRNLGLSDHGLLIHLSEVLAGNIYVIEGGHSTIYEELNVYMTAVKYMFESSPLGNYRRHSLTISQQEVIIEPFQAKQNQNPYYIPWIMRGICNDPSILSNQELKTELNTLICLYHQWHPTSNKLKELKFKLDPLKTLNF
ncbi:hypothetical protein G6F55_008199 [Rhizopus delemar]|uniref:YMC020W-like alpha/beta hydrolase domain-containing protein n=2 Tax=Rhizopus TaxID=4842 RepID=A0A9P6Z1P6_9FUNG|nr:hypothetical protein G6F43_001591 [Rhizopus delemar]KAG1544675.1 hypothetical protein G6F51_005920 [Rhizopus arrhizus]KAG1453327.1 hypothetical protein G6F55_008199 [Rhizopus delemar]KAG1520836.1 hypothetical protein G6F52_007296 [Rhizopus delemar]KAG1553368.1 hypothetical protein G6F49_008382 [Rhizopus delemar]